MHQDENYCYMLNDNDMPASGATKKLRNNSYFNTNKINLLKEETSKIKNSNGETRFSNINDTHIPSNYPHIRKVAMKTKQFEKFNKLEPKDSNINF